MGIRKSTAIVNKTRVHVWTDPDVSFEADVYKRGTEWCAEAHGQATLHHQYQSAVDWVMDEWRLAKSEYGSWDEVVAAMAADLGIPFEDLDGSAWHDLHAAARDALRLP